MFCRTFDATSAIVAGLASRTFSSTRNTQKPCGALGAPALPLQPSARFADAPLYLLGDELAAWLARYEPVNYQQT